MRYLIALALIFVLAAPAGLAADPVTTNGKSSYSYGVTMIRLSDPMGTVYSPGEEVSFRYQTASDAYVVVFNIDTEGFVHLLQPSDGVLRTKARALETYDLPDRREETLLAGGATGVEFVFVLAIPGQEYIDEAELSYLATMESLPREERYRIDGDPFLAANIIAGEIVRGISHRVGIFLGYTYFFINERVDHPCYLCGECDERSSEPLCEDYDISARFDRGQQLTYPLRRGYAMYEAGQGPDARTDVAYGDYDDSADPGVDVEFYPYRSEVRYVTQPTVYSSLYDPFYWGYGDLFWCDPWYYGWNYYPSYGYHHWGAYDGWSWGFGAWGGYYCSSWYYPHYYNLHDYYYYNNYDYHHYNYDYQHSAGKVAYKDGRKSRDGSYTRVGSGNAARKGSLLQDHLSRTAKNNGRVSIIASRGLKTTPKGRGGVRNKDTNITGREGRGRKEARGGYRDHKTRVRNTRDHRSDFKRIRDTKSGRKGLRNDTKSRRGGKTKYGRGPTKSSPRKYKTPTRSSSKTRSSVRKSTRHTRSKSSSKVRSQPRSRSTSKSSGTKARAPRRSSSSKSSSSATKSRSSKSSGGKSSKKKR